MMARSHIADLCSRISDFVQRQEWGWKASPVIVMEVTSMSDYFAAKEALARMIVDEPHYSGLAAASEAVGTRVISSDTCELDCYGVTFRLTCKAIIANERGTRGVNDVIIVQAPPLPRFPYA